MSYGSIMNQILSSENINNIQKTTLTIIITKISQIKGERNARW